MGIFAELKERRLAQIVLSYAGVGWILLEASSQMVERGVLPEFVYRLVLIWFVVGLPATLMIGWHHGEKGDQRAPASEWIVLVLLALIGLGFSGSTVTGHFAEGRIAAAAENKLEMRRVVVTYFVDESGGEYKYLSDAFTEDLINELSQVRALDVISRNGSMQYRDMDIPADSVGKLLQAGTVIEGTIDPRSDKVVINIRMIDAQSGAQLGRTKIERKSEELMEMRAGVVTETALLLRKVLGDEVRTRASAGRTPNQSAWLFAQRAEKTRKDAEALVQNDQEAAWRAFDAADSLLVEALKLDESWADLWVQRATIAYRRAYVLRPRPQQAVVFIQTGLAHADEALKREKTNPRGLEMRGTLNYYHYLLNVTPDPDAAKALRESAREDLDAATQYDPTLASAFATLSHLYYEENLTEALLKATRAYEEDAYLENVELVLWRLFSGSHDLGNFTNAKRWCTEGGRRFPGHYRFAHCALRLMATPGADDPDVAMAWQLLARQDSLTPEARRPFEHARGELFTAGVIARAGLADSARVVLARARSQISPQIDPNRELLVVEAFVHLLNGEKDAAVGLLSQLAAANPDMFRGVGGVTWHWRELESHPRFRQLVGIR